MSKNTFVPLAVIVVLAATGVLWRYNPAQCAEDSPGKHPLRAETVLSSGVQETSPTAVMEVADADNQGAPQITFPVMSHNFGAVSQETKYKYEFNVRNTGDAPLEIYKAKGS